MRLWGKKPEPAHREPYSGPIQLEAIGYVRNEVAKPRPRGWEKVESRIELLEEHRGKVGGLEAFSHVIVVFYMDMAADALEKPAELTLESGRRYGILATRSQLRPNHLGVSAVELLGHDEGLLRVRGLDAIDGTAVLDVKPYLAEYDAFPGARRPG